MRRKKGGFGAQSQGRTSVNCPHTGIHQGGAGNTVPDSVALAVGLAKAHFCVPTLCMPLEPSPFSSPPPSFLISAHLSHSHSPQHPISSHGHSTNTTQTQQDTHLTQLIHAPYCLLLSHPNHFTSTATTYIPTTLSPTPAPPPYTNSPP